MEGHTESPYYITDKIQIKTKMSLLSHPPEIKLCCRADHRENSTEMSLVLVAEDKMYE